MPHARLLTIGDLAALGRGEEPKVARLLALLEEADARLEREDPTAAPAPTDDDGT